jgi:glycosyltransferase involved in cell wall biosynthesis
MYSIVVFAHNEQHGIVRCLESLKQNVLFNDTIVTVLENGSSDNTAQVAKEYCVKNAQVRLHELTIGDKANAWNFYISESAPLEAHIHFFIDGDVWLEENALDTLAKTLLASTAAMAGGVPGCGHSKEKLTRYMLQEHDIVGNFYAVKGTFLARIRESGFRLPNGYIGDDNLINYIVKTDLQPQRNKPDYNQVTIARDARFFYEPWFPFFPSHLLPFLKQQLRYSYRYIQDNLFIPLIKRTGFSDIPQLATSLYSADLKKIAPRSSVPEMVFDRIALRRLLRHVHD